MRRVMSHPLALAQCADFFRTNRGLEAVSVFDTAGGVRLAMEAGDRQTAAIASRRAASLWQAPPSSASASRITYKIGRGSCWSRRRAEDPGRSAAEGLSRSA